LPDFIAGLDVLDYFAFAEEFVDLGSSLREEGTLKSDLHLDLADLKTGLEAFLVFGCPFLAVLVTCKASENIAARSVIDESLEILDNCSSWRLIDVQVEARVRPQEQGAQQMQQQRVIVELMIGLILDLHKDQDGPNEYLRIRQQKNQEDKSLEIQFLIGFYT
jgi:hypothetical protein